MSTATLRRTAAIGVVAASLGAAAPASAAMTMEVGAPTLSARVLITVPVTVSCPPFDPSLVMNSASIRVTVQQASGKQIARGTGAVAGAIPPVFPCDDTEHTVAVGVLADPAGVPFKRGLAVFTIGAFAGAAQPCRPGSTTCFTSPFAGQSAVAGPMTMRVR